MPTSRPRHTITESDEVARALEDAARRWPEDRGARGRLLVRLVKEGHRAVTRDREEELTRRREAVRRTSGALSGAYPADYLDELRGDWPA
ncbi:MAG: hypothetical protein ACRDPC_09375 [Solirubrobacteraceae bacterium]